MCEYQELEVVKSAGKVISKSTIIIGHGNGDISITDLDSPDVGF